ncbi:MAG TPA: hypothetical protein VNF71_11585 [Acidimicrobiales bacterium]|nr:hypothetical protein [Acidimicrobiales bacterium]
MGDNKKTSQPSEATREAERREARAEHTPDRAPTADEEKVAPGRADLKEGVAENFEDMAERGANVKGEGEVP